ncbi:MAG: hypothetical protein ACKPB8_12950, partial [Alphaproteobacteria bacterium]
MDKSSAPRKWSIGRAIVNAAKRVSSLWRPSGPLEARLRRLELSQTIYLGSHEALTRLHTGHRIYVDTRDVSIASHLMLEGRWEPWVERALIPAIKPGMRFVDV